MDVEQVNGQATANRSFLIFSGVCALLCGGLARLFERFPVDDAYISFRYALNAASGHGLVFNPGERVEGVTNLGWTALLAPVAGQAATVAVALSFFALVGIGLAAWRAARTLAVNRWLAGLLSVACPSLVIAAGSGLETAPFAFLTLVALMLYIENRPGASFTVCCALVLLRPEGALIYVGLLVWTALFAKDRQAVFFRLPVYLPLMALAGLTAFRLAYYGEALPNTFFAKTGDLYRDLGSGGRYVLAFFVAYPPLLIGLVARGKAALFSALAGCWLLYVVSIGGDWLNYHRFLVLLIPILILSALALLKNRPRLTLLFAASLAVSFVWQGAQFGIEGRQTSGYRERFFADGFTRFSGAVPGQSVATANIGYFGYVNPDLVIHDLLGLTDRHIAHSDPHPEVDLQGHQKFDIDYSLSRSPDFFITNHPFYRDQGDFLEIGNPHSLHPVERAFLSSPRFADQYEAASTKVSDDLWIWFWKRKANQDQPL